MQWIGRPIPRFFGAKSTSIFLFAIPWTAFAVFWMCGAAGFRIPDFQEGFGFFPLFGAPFVLVGLGMMSYPLWFYRSSLKTVYVVTDRRAITFQGAWSTTIRSYLPAQLTHTFRRERRDGSGDVVISERSPGDSDGNRPFDELGFFQIPNPREVEKMLKELAASRAEGGDWNAGR